MNTIELESYFDQLLPRSLSCEWDNDGVMLASCSDRDIKKVLLTLDITEEAARKAVEIGADAIFTHHPFIFRGMKSISDRNARSCLTIELLNRGISVLSYHTRLDAADGGVNDILAELLGLKDTSILGAGDLGMARVGQIDETPLDDFASLVSRVLSCPSLLLARAKGGRDKISRVAVLGGACDMDFITGAIEAGADVLVTGDASYNNLIDANLEGLHVLCAGHYSSENPVLSYFERKLIALGIECFRYDCGYFEYLK